MPIHLILAWPGTTPTIMLTTAALHHALFSRRSGTPTKTILVVAALLVPSTVAWLDTRIAPPGGEVHEDLMPDLFEALLLAFCTIISTMSCLVRLRQSRSRRWRHGTSASRMNESPQEGPPCTRTT